MAGDLVPLEDLSCDYEFNERVGGYCYRFRWKRIQDYGIQWVCIIPLEGTIDSFLQFGYKNGGFWEPGRYPEGVLIRTDAIPSNQIQRREFVVVGLRNGFPKELKMVAVPVAEYLRNQDENHRILCSAVLANGRIEWQMVRKPGERYVLKLSSTIEELEEGHLFYSFEYNGLTIRQPVPGRLRKGTVEYQAIRFPKEARRIEIFSDNAGIEVKELKEPKQRGFTAIITYFKRKK